MYKSQISLLKILFIATAMPAFFASNFKICPYKSLNHFINSFGINKKTFLKSCTILLLLCCSTYGIKAQELIFSKDLIAESVHIDDMSNIYVQSKNSILKFDDTGQLEQRYNTRSYGDIYSFDVQNPYKILLFYKNFGKIVILDNMLSTLSMIDLQKLSFSDVQLVATSYQDGFWVYDNIQKQLSRFNSTSKIQIKTGNLEHLLNKKIHPKMMVERNNKLYLLNDSNVLIFDIYGSYLKTIPTGKIKLIQAGKNNLYYLKDNNLYAYNYKTFEIKKSTLSVENVQYFSLQKNTLALLTPKHFYLYNLK